MAAPGDDMIAIAWGDPVDGLRLGLRAAGDRIVVAFWNVGEKDRHVNMGTVNGSGVYFTGFCLEIERPRGRPLRLVHIPDDRHLAGRIDDLVAPLPIGSRYAVQLPEAFWATHGLDLSADLFWKELDPVLDVIDVGALDLVGAHDVVATFTSLPPQDANLVCWTGTLRSGTVTLD